MISYKVQYTIYDTVCGNAACITRTYTPGRIARFFGFKPSSTHYVGWQLDWQRNPDGKRAPLPLAVELSDALEYHRKPAKLKELS